MGLVYANYVARGVSPPNETYKIMGRSRKIKNENQDVDIRLIRDNLKLSFEERIARHQNTLDFIDTLKQAGRQIRAKSSGTFKTAHQQPR